MARESTVIQAARILIGNWTDNVYAIQIRKLVLLACIGIREKRQRVSSLECCNGIELPATQHLLRESIAVNAAVKRQLVKSADDQALRRIEVRKSVIKLVVYGVCPLRGSRAEAGLLIDRLRQSIRNSELQAVVERPIRRDLQLVAMREAVAKIRKQLLRPSW